MASLIDRAKSLRMSDSVTTSAEGRQRLVLLQAAYRLYGPRVYSLCVRLLNDSDGAQEATVNVFVRFRKELTRRWDEQVIVRRLGELAIDEALDRLWGPTREGPRKTAIEEVTQRALAETDRCESRVRASQDLSLGSATLNELIAKLPDALRVVFVLYDIEGLKHRDIAKYLRVREPDIRVLIGRARLEIRRQWLSHG